VLLLSRIHCLIVVFDESILDADLKLCMCLNINEILVLSIGIYNDYAMHVVNSSVDHPPGLN